jgi:hypothetical protein
MPGPVGPLASQGGLLDIIQAICPNTPNKWNSATLQHWLRVAIMLFPGSFTCVRGYGEGMVSGVERNDLSK